LVRHFDTGAKGADWGVLAYAPDGKTIATPGAQYEVLIWDVATGARLRQFVGYTTWPHSAVFSPDGKTLCIGNPAGTVRLWDVATGQAQRVFRGAGAGLSSMALSPDGRFVAAGYGDGTVIFWDLARQAQPPILSG